MELKKTIEELQKIRRELWVFYHETEEWQIQTHISSHLDSAIGQLKEQVDY